MKKKQVILHPDNKIVEIDGVMYREKKIIYKKIGHTTHIDKLIYEEFDDTELKNKMKELEYKLSQSIPSERVAEEVIKKMSIVEIEKLHNLIFKKKAKVKRVDGCLGIEISGGKRKNAYIEIFD